MNLYRYPSAPYDRSGPQPRYKAERVEGPFTRKSPLPRAAGTRQRFLRTGDEAPACHQGVHSSQEVGHSPGVSPPLDASPPAPGTALPTILGDFPAEEFVQSYFQKEPLFLRQALPEFDSLLSPEELFELACQEEVEARLVQFGSEKDAPQGRPYQLRHGPFTRADLTCLGEKDWTLLVQDVDKWVGPIAELLSLVSFLPRWSVDDIMVSFAKKGGSVGPHTDRYDVFLLQVLGTRRWEISSNVDPTDLREDTDLRVLRNFQGQKTFTARPGDVLYLPPGVAHYGIAEGDCLTYSFGFRAPSEALLLSSFSDELVSRTSDELFREQLTGAVAHPAELSPDLLQGVRVLVRSKLEEMVRDCRWVGRTLTEPKPNIVEAGSGPLGAEEIRRMLSEDGSFSRSSASRFLFAEEEGQVFLFVDGEDFPLSAFAAPRALAELLCEAEAIEGGALASAAGTDNQEQLSALLHELDRMGALAVLS